MKSRLEQQLKRWVEASLLSADQASRISAFEEERQKGVQAGRFIKILSVIGGAFLATGLVLIIAHNWQHIHRWVKLTSLFALMGGGYWAGYELKYGTRWPSPRAGEGLLLASAALFLAGIGLVSQIYHLNDRPATGVLVWWMGIMALPYLAESLPLHWLSLAAGLMWLGMESTTPGSLFYIASEEYVWCHGITGVGLLLWMGGLAHARRGWERFHPIMENTGLVLFFSSLYMLGFIHHEGGSYAQGWASVSSGWLVAGSLSTVWIAKWLPGDSQWHRNRLILLVGLVLGLWWAMWPGMSGIVDVVTLRHTLSGLSWITLFLLSLMMLNLGLRWKRPAWINLGVVFIFLNAITRFFDLFGDMLHTGLLFLAGGVILLVGGGYLERMRRGLMNQMRAS